MIGHAPQGGIPSPQPAPPPAVSTPNGTPPAAPPSRRDPTRAVVLGLALLAAGLQILRLTRPHALLAGGFDDTAFYLGSAIRFVHGAMPYRDFALLQPPGLLLLFSPFALLSNAVGSRGAMIALTATGPLLAAANVALLGRLIAHRGWRATLAACGLMATYPAMFAAVLDGLQEPLMVLLCLAGAVLIFDGDAVAGPRRLAAGGAAMGFAVSVLVAAVVPALVVAVLCARRWRSRLLPFSGGAAAGLLVPVIPFLAVSPGSLVHDTVITQLERVSGAQPTSLSSRLLLLSYWPDGKAAAVAIAAVMAVVIVAGFVLVRRRLTPLDWFAVGAAVILGTAQLVIAIYYNHFPAMLIPYPALLLGTAVQRLSPVWGPRLVPAAVAIAIALVSIGQVRYIEGQSAEDWAPAVDAVVPVDACALASHPQILIQADRIWSPVPGCTTLVDFYATRLAEADTPEGVLSAYQTAIAHTDYLVLETTLGGWLAVGPSPLTPSERAPLAAYVTDHFDLHRSGGLNIWVRDGYSPVT
jgi:alpha-1,2-mannosyltransferase